jgi:hypothetical protein
MLKDGNVKTKRKGVYANSLPLVSIIRECFTSFVLPGPSWFPFLPNQS